MVIMPESCVHGHQKSHLIGSIQKFSIEDGPGIRTTIFMKGCPLSCKWCHNPELISPQQQLIKSPNNCIGCGHCVSVCPEGAIAISQEDGIVIDRDKCKVCLKCANECYAQALRPATKPMTIDEILEVAEQDKGFYDNTGGGITLSGGEILMNPEFVCDLIDAAGEKGIKVCIDTSGFGDSNSLMEIATKENVTDILYDMKSMDDDIHKEYIGVSNRLILDNLRLLASDGNTAPKLIMRMPLVKGINDSSDIIRKTGELYKELGIRRVNLLPYHSLGINKQKNIGGAQERFEEPTEERLTEIENYFKDELKLDVQILGRL